MLLYYYYIYFKLTSPLRCLRVPPEVRVPQVEYHWSNVLTILLIQGAKKKH
jgi:hypothetical protein